MQSEKQASSEIAESRERFEKWCPITIVNIDKAPKAAALKSAYWTAWQAAERDTRERLAQLAIDAIKEIMRDHFPSRMFTQEIELVCVRVAERIRGKE